MEYFYHIWKINQNKNTAVYRGYEYIKKRSFLNGNVQLGCLFYKTFKFRCTITTKDLSLVRKNEPEQNHELNLDLI